MNKGTILDIQRFSTEDGPGIRTTVFMKGCPLACKWCHNPESISPKPQLQWLGVGCLLCADCVSVCKRNGLQIKQDGIDINRGNCIACGDCARACPAAVLKISGEEWDIDELVAELIKDRTYFEKSNGGVTISGGEAMMQSSFVAKLLSQLQNDGIHTAIDTCGHTSPDALNGILPYANLVLFDLKEMDSECHRVFTGKGNARILNNAKG
ncbi:MAG: glycyl-radical enzyme activating protein, partial [Deltaproteobacteria bacterium]